jgi:hypothetical protein
MGLVGWDKGSGLFYDLEENKPVTLQEAQQHIRYNPAARRFIDERGRFAPSSVMRSQLVSEHLIERHDDAGNAHVSGALRTETVDPSVLEGRYIRPNENVVIRVVFYYPDGHVGEVRVSGGMGRQVDLDELIDLAKAKADAQWRETQGLSYRPQREQALQEIEPYVITIEVQIVSINRL